MTGTYVFTNDADDHLEEQNGQGCVKEMIENTF